MFDIVPAPNDIHAVQHAILAFKFPCNSSPALGTVFMPKKIAQNILICLIVIFLMGIVFFLFGLLFGWMFDMYSSENLSASLRLFAIWYGVCAVFFVPFVGIWTYRNARKLEAIDRDGQET
jgi:hypothetical protein